MLKRDQKYKIVITVQEFTTTPSPQGVLEDKRIMLNGKLRLFLQLIHGKKDNHLSTKAVLW